MKLNKILIVLLPVIVLSATRSTADSDVATSDGSDDAAAVLVDSAAKGGAEVRYLVPHMRSAAFATGIGGRVTTVITATNGGTTPCNVTFDYYFAFNSSSNPQCTVNATLVPLLAPGTDTVNVCSRSIPGDRWTLCTATCSPSLSFIQGKAIVTVPQSCAAAVALDARMYHSDTSDDVRTINSMAVYRLKE